MSLKKQIEEAIKTALLARKKEDLLPLRAIKSMILLAETKDRKQQLDKNQEIELLVKAANQRKEAGAIFKKEGRDELYQKEIDELEIINRYLPSQLSEEEVEAKLKQIITAQKAGHIRDMGKVMGVATKELVGKTDNKTIYTIVKRLLSS